MKLGIRSIGYLIPDIRLADWIFGQISGIQSDNQFRIFFFDIKVNKIDILMLYYHFGPKIQQKSLANFDVKPGSDQILKQVGPDPAIFQKPDPEQTSFRKPDPKRQPLVSSNL